MRSVVRSCCGSSPKSTPSCCRRRGNKYAVASSQRSRTRQRHGSHSFGAVVQLLWLVRELVKTRTREVRSGCLRLADDALVRYRSGMLITPRIQMEPIMISLLRQIVGGDTTSKNIWLVEMLVTIHRENRFVDLRGARSLSRPCGRRAVKQLIITRPQYWRATENGCSSKRTSFPL